MALAQELWQRVSMRHIVLAWLRSERDSENARMAWRTLDEQAIASLLDKPDLKDLEQNRLRLRLLYILRSSFMLEIPPDTEWYQVCSLTNASLTELHVVNHPNWIDPGDDNELLKVATRKMFTLSSDPNEWDTQILWG